MSEAFHDAIFWIEIDKIKPNPYQPRHEFNEDRLRDLSDSIRQYGVLQPLVVTKKEYYREDGSLYSEYELIAGERRWRASRMAGLSRVPALIRTGEETDKLKLEMAIIENLQREDLNPLDRAQAFQKLVTEFSLKHVEVAKKIGKSREYVSNSIRILALPQEVLDALMAGKITEGHTRPILMLNDRPEEQITLFKEILIKKLNVRETEQIARRIAYDKVRKKENFIEPSIIAMEEQLTEKFGTRVKVEKRESGGRVTIDFFSNDDMHKILNMLGDDKPIQVALGEISDDMSDVNGGTPTEDMLVIPEDIASKVSENASLTETPKEDEDLYSVRNFSL